jgi:hypothetical protein
VTKNKIGLKEQRRIEAAQKKRKQTLSIVIPAVLVVGAIVALIIISGAGANIEGIFDFGIQDRGHDEGVVFEAGGLPPVGGTHSPRWQTCGIYDQPVESKNAVHSMEHGAVWITYSPELATAEIETLRDLVQGQSYLLLTPFPNLDSDVVLTAWGIQLPVNSVDDDRIAQFIDEYRLGPQTPEFGATCDGGVGQPIG